VTGKTAVLVAIASVFLLPPATAQGTGTRASDRDATHPHIVLSSLSEELTIRLGGELNFDYLEFDAGENNIPDAGSQENDFIVRRGRMYLSGSLHEVAEFKIKAGLELTGTPIIDAFAVLHMPWGIDCHAGQLKVPFSEERLRSYSRQPFMERGLAHSLALRRSQGVYFSAEPGNRGLAIEAGTFTGESLNKHNTDDQFEYACRLSLRLDKLFPSFPGRGAIRMAAAAGMRRPVRAPTMSFFGKTMNGLEFFAPVPVNGMRTRYEADAEFSRRWFWAAAEWVGCEEERDGVRILIDTDGDGRVDGGYSSIRVNPLLERGWMAYAVVMVTGEDASDWIVPARKSGALSLAVRYSTISFDSQERHIQGCGTYGVEVNETSEALGRPSIDETASDLYVGLNWYLKPGIFVQGAAVWQWFDHSSPTMDGGNSDINYRWRLGVVF